MAETPSTAPAAGRSVADLRTRARAASRRPWARELFALAFACLASIVLATIALQLWDSPDLHQPLVYGNGDGLGVLATFKGIQDWGWVWTNPSLGAPLGLEYYDYGSHGPENLHWVLVWLISLVAQQPGTAYNAFLMLTFPLSAASAYGVFRALGISRLAAVAPAALFAVVPYHFLRGGVGHLLLADTVAVPLGLYLALALMLGFPLFRRRTATDGPRLLRWVSWTSVRTALLLVVVASTGIYYAAFAMAFVVVAAVAAWLARRDGGGRTVLLPAAAVLVGLGLVLAFNLAPTVLYTQEYGANAFTGQRDSERELGLRPQPRSARSCRRRRTAWARSRRSAARTGTTRRGRARAPPGAARCRSWACSCSRPPCWPGWSPAGRRACWPTRGCAPRP